GGRAGRPAVRPASAQRAVRRERQPLLPLAPGDHAPVRAAGWLRLEQRLPDQPDAARGRRPLPARRVRLGARMRVCMLTPEAFPYAKTGGLADVLAALPAALARLGVEGTVMLPAYREALRTAGPRERLGGGWGGVGAPASSRLEPATIVRVAGARVPTLMVQAPRYFDRDGLYGAGGHDHPDNAERFVFFCRAALEWLRGLGTPPDIVHCH